MHGSWTRWLAAIPVAAFFVAGCGSTIDIAEFDPTNVDGGTGDDGGGSGTDSGGTTTDSGGTTTDGSIGTDGGGEDAEPPPPDAAVDTAPPPPPLSLENVCERLADAVCTSSYAACCGTKGFEYKEVGCRAAITAGCGVEVAEVKAGKGTFNADAFDKCAAAWATLASTCTVPLFDYLETYSACNQLFPGTVAPGATCSEDSDCKVPEGYFANCRDDGRCEAVGIAQKDKSCNQSWSTATKTYCDYGLYCSSSTGTGTCRQGKATGESCTQSYECGFGNWCERAPGSSSGKCAKGLAFNASCSFDSQCASGDCRSGKCTDPNVTPAAPSLCSGATGG